MATWDDFADAPEASDDPWAAFEDAPSSSRSRRRRTPKGGTSQPEAGDITGAIDGDTLDTSGANVRVWGVDAPELRQQGWNRQGEPVPIGQHSRNALSDTVLNQNAALGPVQHQSFGRPVAPITVGDQDVGQQQVRTGNALAAPEYLTSDPERRSDYMQSERLARQNRQGLHNTFNQTPQEFRKEPMAAPDRETVAQFWDTPTPMAGMRPEVEQEYIRLINDLSVPPKKVLEFARANGFQFDPAQLIQSREIAQKDPQQLGISYQAVPKPLTDQGDGAVGAGARGLANGVLPNFLEETGAIVDTFGGTSGRENVFNSDRRLADIFVNNLDQNEAIVGHDRLAHPYVTGASEVVGGVIVPIGRVRSAADLAKWGGAFGTVAGLGQDGTIPERLTSGVIGAGVGVGTTVLGGKALEAAAPHVGRAWSRVTGKGSGGAPEASTGGSDDVSLPRGRIGVETPSAGRDGASMAMADVSQDMPARQRDYLFPVEPPRPISQPMTEAQMRAAAQGVDPRDVLPIPSNMVGSAEELAQAEAGRFAPAKPINEATALESRTITAQNGREMPKRGPSDLVTWLRTQGGIKDQGGNLRAMGIDNSPRDLDFARGEQRFGRLIDENGMDLDDAAMRAWEAGYLPGSERPDINTLLEAIDRTHRGSERFFLPDDLDEVARFEGLRADRQQLEEQLADGPVVVDRSVPADEPQPFPPAQAYEEWPSGGPDFAGNIRLEKLESPQDIKRALDFTERRVGFDAATRGRVTHAETEKLASALGMTPETLLSRRKGQALNAEEALAARQILAKSGNELVNLAKRVRGLDEPGDELLAQFRHAWMRHVAIQEQVSGATAEAGRALSQFRMAANSRAVRGDVLGALVRGGGGMHNLKNAADVLLDAVEVSPGKFNSMAKKAASPKWSRRVGELYINFLLSNPATHVVNMTSNTLTAMAQIPEHATAAMIGKAREAFTRTATDRIVASEIGARVFGMIQGAKEGAYLMARAVKTGEPSDHVSKVEGEDYKAIPGLAGKVIRIPTRLLTAEDELFKGIARRMELNGLAARQAHKEGLKGEAARKRIAELSSNPPDAMLEQAMEYGRYLTFQKRLGGFAQSVSNASQQNIVAKLYLPFVRTPTNLLKFAAERSPAAPFMPSWRKEFAAGGARRDLAVAKMMVGTGFGIAIYQAALNGHLTGAAPSDPKKARLLYADGWQPYSIKLGDTYYSYKRLDPFAMTLGVAADLATLPEGMSQRQRDDQATLLVASVMGNLASKTWLSGVSDLVEAISDPARNTGNMLERLAGSLLVPAGVAGVARAIDPTARQTDTVGEAIRGRIPGLRDDLLPRRDIWGEEVTYDSGFLSPAYTSEALNDPVNIELLKLDYAPGYASKKVGGVELTPEEHDAYQEQSGKLTHERLGDLVTAPAWKSMDVAERAKAAKQAADKARKEVRERLFGGGKSEPAEDNDEWEAFTDAPGQKSEPAKDDPWSVFKDPEQRDVIGNLTKIPGITMDGLTSGYRTPKYQADMRRRGYKPAANSGHLDGSSLDIVVPSGRSMGWLMAQVKRVEPKAKLLPEGDHLHATFPGWYGAPVLGGAKAAGLSNPMAAPYRP